MRAHTSGESHYQHLVVMSVLSFLAMYALMYAMVDSTRNVYMNFNQIYMAALMSAPMVLIELWVMHGMYGNGRRNAFIVAGCCAIVIGAFALIRQQAAISDRQFLRSMIPHHASAILMCEETPAQDAEIRALCRNIIANQQAEIDQMKAKLNALDK